MLTDTDSIETAFAALAAAGIDARYDYQCCMTCGMYGIARDNEGKATRGYAFFHGQDLEAALEGRDLYIAYGSMTADRPDLDLAIGRQVRDALEAEELTVRWNEDPKRRIRIVGPVLTDPADQDDEDE